MAKVAEKKQQIGFYKISPVLHVEYGRMLELMVAWRESSFVCWWGHFVDVKCYNIQAILEVSGVCFVLNRICQYYKMYSVTTQLIYACNLAPTELLYHVCEFITTKT